MSKHLQRLPIVCLVLMLLGCENIFHEEADKYQIIDNDQEVLDLLVGVYDQLNKVYNSNYLKTLARADDINYYPNYHFTEKNGSCGGSGDQIDYTTISGHVYLHLYTAILNLNKLILSEYCTDKTSILGELYFLRAYSYYLLARLYGTPPLVTDTDVNYFVEKPTYREVYEFIEQDMLKALDMLPENHSLARIPGESPDQGKAKALLAEIYLSMAGYPVYDLSKYSLAAELAGEVIENTDLYNYHLLDDFANLWKEGEYRHNAECIFGLFYSGDSWENSNQIMGSTFTYYPIIIKNTNVSPFYQCDISFFMQFPDNYRWYNSFLTGRYRPLEFDTLDGSVETRIFEPFDPINEPCRYVGGAVSLKWFDKEAAFTQVRNFRNSKNAVTLYLLRYAQTLLTYAEAKARAGQLDASCYESINMVRRRANHVNIYAQSTFDLQEGLSTEQFLDSVVWERAWELCVEPNGRWFDIVRLDLKDEIEANRYEKDIALKIGNDALTEDWYFYKIPQQDRWVNPNYADN